MRLSVIVACRNRKDLTILAVNSAVTAAAFANVDIDFTIFDDGSSDGTVEALGLIAADITILQGDGSAYWARSMALAEAHVLQRSDEPDAIVWLNDDVVLDVDSFASVQNKRSLLAAGIVVGATRDPRSAVTTYTGWVKTGWHPLRFSNLEPTAAPQKVDTFNGNFVVVPTRIARRLGGIDGQFSHSLADIDYGLRCGRLSIPVWLLPGTCGTCPRNPPDPDDGLSQKWHRFLGTKGGGNYGSLRRILRKGSPYLWPAYIAVTYSMWWVRNLRKVIARPRPRRVV